MITSNSMVIGLQIGKSNGGVESAPLLAVPDSEKPGLYRAKAERLRYLENSWKLVSFSSSKSVLTSDLKTFDADEYFLLCMKLVLLT